MEGTTEIISIALTSEQWKVLEFLVRRGVVAEMDRHLTAHSHTIECLSSFTQAHKAMHDQLPAFPDRKAAL